MKLRAAVSLLLFSSSSIVASASELQTSLHPWGSYVPNSTNCFSNKTTGKFINRFVQESEQATSWLEICSSDTNAAAESRLDKLKDCKEISCCIQLTAKGKIQPGSIMKSSENSDLDQEFLSILRDSPSLKYAPPNFLPFRPNVLQANCKNGKVSIVLVRP